MQRFIDLAFKIATAQVVIIFASFGVLIVFAGFVGSIYDYHETREVLGYSLIEEFRIIWLIVFSFWCFRTWKKKREEEDESNSS